MTAGDAAAGYAPVEPLEAPSALPHRAPREHLQDALVEIVTGRPAGARRVRRLGSLADLATPVALAAQRRPTSEPVIAVIPQSAARLAPPPTLVPPAPEPDLQRPRTRVPPVAHDLSFNFGSGRATGGRIGPERPPSDAEQILEQILVEYARRHRGEARGGARPVAAPAGASDEAQRKRSLVLVYGILIATMILAGITAVAGITLLVALHLSP